MSDNLVRCDYCGSVVSPKEARAENRVKELQAEVAALRHALAGMVRLHCSRSGHISVSCPENIQALRMLEQAGAVVIERETQYVVQGRWVEPWPTK